MPGSWKRVRTSYAGVKSLLQKRRVPAVVNHDRVAWNRGGNRARERGRVHHRRSLVGQLLERLLIVQAEAPQPREPIRFDCETCPRCRAA